MSSIRSNLLRSQLSLLTPLLNRMDLETQRRMQDRLGNIGAKALSECVHYEDVLELSACWAYPELPEPGKAILYLHGGGYVAGSLHYARGFGGLLAQRMNWAALCVGYRLAPENPFPAALDDAVAAYRYMLERYSPDRIAFIGESAGGGLCWSLALRCKALRLPLPACIVAISPWTDLTMSGGDCPKDPVLDRQRLIESARMYAGEDVKNPLVSPLFGDLHGLPHSLMFAGDMEILMDDTLRLAEKLTEAGCVCETHIAEEMWHVYVLYGVPEAKEALERIREFLAEETERAQRT